MNRELARKVADSVLYEGYMLYPYRPSAIKNRQRWTFGVLYPPAYAEVINGTERSRMHSECLVRSGSDASAGIRIELRFLHLNARQVFRPIQGAFEPVPSLAIDGRLAQSWDEGKKTSVVFEFPLGAGDRKFEFGCAETKHEELLRDSAGEVVGKVGCVQKRVQGTLSAVAQEIRADVRRLSIDVENQTRLSENADDRNSVLPRSLLCAQLILSATGAQFISLLDPPEDLKQAAAGCRNVGNFPVSLGSPGEHEMMLCSPILLYDYPQVAPESAGDFYDATEIDEMLTLRVMNLTHDEKTELRHAGEPLRALLERTEATAREQLMRTHGAVRQLREITEAGSEKRK
jgi:hypothetical protein